MEPVCFAKMNSGSPNEVVKLLTFTFVILDTLQHTGEQFRKYLIVGKQFTEVFGMLLKDIVSRLGSKGLKSEGEVTLLVDALHETIEVVKRVKRRVKQVKHPEKRLLVM